MKSYNQYINKILSEQTSGKEQLEAIKNYSMDWMYKYSDDHKVYTDGEKQRIGLQYLVNNLVEKIRSGEVTDVKIEEVEEVVKKINDKFMGSTSIKIYNIPRDINKEIFDDIKKMWPINGNKAEQLMKSTKDNSFAIKKAGSKNEFLLLPKANEGEVVWRTVESESKMMPFRNPLPRLFKYVLKAGLEDKDFEIVSSKIGR